MTAKTTKNSILFMTSSQDPAVPCLFLFSRFQRPARGGLAAAAVTQLRLSGGEAKAGPAGCPGQNPRRPTPYRSLPWLRRKLVRVPFTEVNSETQPARCRLERAGCPVKRRYCRPGFPGTSGRPGGLP